MSFTTNIFLTILLPLTFGIVWLFRKNILHQNIFILLISITFLLMNGLSGILLLAIMCIMDYFFIRLIQHNYNSKVSTLFFVLSLVLNITPLFLFKYTGFLLDNINNTFGTVLVLPQWTLPVGISFYTFQAISLLSDVKTKK